MFSRNFGIADENISSQVPQLTVFPRGAGRRSDIRFGIWDLPRKVTTKAKFGPLGQNWDFFGTIFGTFWGFVVIFMKMEEKTCKTDISRFKIYLTISEGTQILVNKSDKSDHPHQREPWCFVGVVNFRPKTAKK